MTNPGGGDEGIGLEGLEGLADYDQESWVASESARVGAGFPTAQDNFAVKFAQLLMDVAAGLVQGAIDLGGAVIGAVTNIVDGIVNLVKNIAGAVLGGGSRAAAAGLPDSFEGDLGWIADAQRELNDRVELMQDVSGYGNVTIGGGGQNYWTVPSNWSTRNDWMSGVVFPFGVQIGPVKNVEVEDFGLRFTGWGTWKISAQMTAEGTLTVGGASRLYMEIQVFNLKSSGSDPSTLISRSGFYEEVPSFHRSYSWHHTVVIPPEWVVDEEGALLPELDLPRVRVVAWQSRGGGVRFPIGDQFAALSVDRLDLRTDGPLNNAPGELLPDQ